MSRADGADDTGSHYVYAATVSPALQLILDMGTVALAIYDSIIKLKAMPLPRVTNRAPPIVFEFMPSTNTPTGGRMVLTFTDDTGT